MMSLRWKLLGIRLCQMRSLSGSAFTQTSLLAVGSSTAIVNALITGQHYSSLACNPSVTDTGEWLDSGLGRNLAKITERREEFVKQGHFLNQLAGLNDIDLVASLEKIVKPLQMRDTIEVGNIEEVNLVQNINKQFCNTNRLCTDNVYLQASPAEEVVTEKEDPVSQTNVLNSKPVLENSSNNMSQSSEPGDSDKKRTGPTPAMLEDIKNYYLDQIPYFHKQGEDFKRGFHHSEIVFENYFFRKPKITRGLQKYLIQILKYRAFLAVSTPHVNFEVQSIFCDQEDATVTVHWRCNYISNWGYVKSLFSFSMMSKRHREQYLEFEEGLSTLYVNRDGKIVKHHLDRRTPMKSTEMKAAETIAAKLASIKAVETNPSLTSTSPHPVSNNPGKQTC